MTPLLAAAGLRFKAALGKWGAGVAPLQGGWWTYKKGRAKLGRFGGGEDLRILFITSTRVGDAILSTGLLAHLIERHSDARVTIACGRRRRRFSTPCPTWTASSCSTRWSGRSIG